MKCWGVVVSPPWRLLSVVSVLCITILVLPAAQSPASALSYSEEQFRQDMILHSNWSVVPEWPPQDWPAISKDDLRAELDKFAPFGYDEDWIRCAEAGIITTRVNDDREWAVPLGVMSESIPHRESHGYDIVELQYLFAAGIDLHVYKTSDDSFISRICGNPSPIVVPVPGTLIVRKFDDSNMNGVWDAGEPEKAGWPVSYSGPQSGSGLTPLSVDLPRGSYTVSEGARTCWAHTTSATRSATVASCDTTTVRFGNVELGAVCGLKWDDTNCNGLLDGEEVVLPDWDISLTGHTIAGGQVDLGPQATDANGEYRFSHLYPSDGVGYTVSEALDDAEHWGPTFPLDPALTQVPDPMLPRAHVVILGEGDHLIGTNFGNVRLGTISGMKYYDANGDLPPYDPRNGNGQYDEGEPLLEGWMFTLTGPCDLGLDVAPRTAYTDDQGVSTFPRLYPTHVDDGYTICEDLPEDWILTYPQQPCRTTQLDEAQEIADGFSFGNIVIEPHPVRTVGYWKNHPEAITRDMYRALCDLPAFRGINNWKKLEPILAEGNAVDVSVMLRAQLAAMELNVIAGFVPLDTWVYVGSIPGGPALFGGNIVYLEQILQTVESAYPWDEWSRSTQEAAKDALDLANNGDILVSPVPLP
jgi:hypothetical protein